MAALAVPPNARTYRRGTSPRGAGSGQGKRCESPYTARPWSPICAWGPKREKHTDSPTARTPLPSKLGDITPHHTKPPSLPQQQTPPQLTYIATARPERLKVSDITQEELAEIVRRIMEADPDSDFYLRLLEANVLHPRVSDLIFWPPEELQDATAEEIVEAALKYRPIAL
ncbi:MULTISPECIES: bacteriocin immunity protein [unclassified Streptosporangium]|uniref:bacteriocin immunity protein n=1 Tax=unclassified Streptosporangium TaxID=2632669 RepID=UPI002E2810D1|nr:MULTISPECIES: bacteriocin immunity protein [unclassified Streptosporangium]